MAVRVSVSCHVILWLIVCGGCGPLEFPHHHPHQEEEGEAVAKTVTVWTEVTEAFVEYPPLVAGADPAPWLIHLTRRSDHSPISDGTVSVQIGTVTIPAVTATSQGVFSPEVSLSVSGTFAATVTFDGPNHRECIALGPVVVYASSSDIPASGYEEAGIIVTKEVQWSLPMRIEQAQEGDVRRSVLAPGVIEAAASRTAEVVAPVSGLLLARANLSIPAEGARVARDDVLATIAPLSTESSFAAVKARTEQARQELDRLTRLHEIGAVPQNRFLNAQREFNVAQSALQALGGVSGAASENHHYVVRAPITGFVEDRAIIAGEAVDVGDLLFRIVDASSVWLRLLLHVRDTGHANNIEGVSFTVEGSDRVYTSTDLIAVGSEIATENRTLPVIFAVPNTDRSLRIGLFADTRVILGTRESGVLLPDDAVQKEDGAAVVYVQVDGERFARRPVVLGGSDGTHTVVASGVEPGEYVVTHGAYSVYLASVTIGGGAAHHH